jgi:hypothetical protein
MLGIAILAVPTHAMACGAYPIGMNANDQVLGMVADGSGFIRSTAQSNAGASRQGMLVYNRSNNTLLMCDGGSWRTLAAAGGVAAAGSTAQVQFNNAGALGASDRLTFDSSSGYLNVYSNNFWSGFISEVYSNDPTHGPFVSFLRGRGTKASPAFPQSGDLIGGVSFRNHDNTGGAEIRASAANNWAANQLGGNLTFLTAPSNSASVAERMRITSAGNVGIGTATPSNLLQVGSGTSTAVAEVRGDGAAYEAGLRVWNDNTATTAAAYIDFGLGSSPEVAAIHARKQTDGSNDLVFQASNSSAVRSDHIYLDGSSGNVGIGTTTPALGLSVQHDNGNGWTAWFGASSASDRVGLGVRSSRASVQGFNASGNAANLVIQPDGGNVGIGTASPLGRLHTSGGYILGSGAGNANPMGIQIGRVEGTNELSIGISHMAGGWAGGTAPGDAVIRTEGITRRLVFDTSGGGGTPAITILPNNGNVGIGTTTPSHPLQMASGAHVTTGGVWTNASDARLKTDVRPIAYGLSDILKLKPVAYTFKADGSKQIGFLAQDVRDVIPELVTGEEGDIAKSETLGLSYDQLTAVLVEAVRELKADNDDLRQENTAQDAAIDALRTELKDLKAASSN